MVASRAAGGYNHRRECGEYDLHPRETGWPEFTWDAAALAGALAAVRHKQAAPRQDGGSRFRPAPGGSLTALTDEVVKSSAIEGENLNPEEVRSSIAQRLGLDVAGLPKPGREVEGVVEMMLDATRNFEEPLTAERLFGWHAALFPTGRSGMHRITVGAWRTGEAGPMQVVSGPHRPGEGAFPGTGGRAPRDRDEAIPRLVQRATRISILCSRPAVAHFWFVTIHPFEDGNGRIARAIADMALSGPMAPRTASTACPRESRRSGRTTTSKLEVAQRGELDITAWLAWFLGCLDRTIEVRTRCSARAPQGEALAAHQSSDPVNERQRKVINRMLDDFKGP